MSNVIRFPRARVIRPVLAAPEHRSCTRIVLSTDRDDVTMIADETLVTMTPMQARAVGRDLLELADEAECQR